jgi:hypothetical protein
MSALGNQRDLFLAVVTVRANRVTDFVLYPLVASCGQRFIEMMEAINEAATTGGGGAGIEALGDLNDYVFFSLGEEQLPLDVLVEEIPQPGVLIALRSPGRESQECDEFERLLVTTIRMKLSAGDEFRKYMSGFGPRFQPIPICGLDVFISYASEDAALAVELKQSMTESGLKCFVAKNIQAGALWREEILAALRSARVVVLLLTSRSIASKWVMCEMGAFWALGKPIVPAAMSGDLGEVPEIISEHQCWHVGDAANRTEFLQQVHRLCRPYA